MKSKYIYLFIVLAIIVVVGIFGIGYLETATLNPNFVHVITSEKPLMFGNGEFIVSEPQYSSKCDQEMKTNAPSPSAECWSAQGTYMGGLYVLNYGELTQIKDYLAVVWKTNAMIDNGQLEDFDRTDTLEVYFDVDKAVEFTTSVSEYTKLGSDAIVTLNVQNNMPNSNFIIDVKQTGSMFYLGNNVFYEHTTPFNNGLSEQIISIPLSNLGDNKLEVSLIPIILYSGGEYKEATTKQSVSSNVVSSVIFEQGGFEEEELPNNVIVTTTEYKKEESTTTSILTNNIIWSVLIIATIGVIVYLGYLIWRKK